MLSHLRHPLLALDLIHAHVAGDLMVFQSMQRGATRVAPIAADCDFFETAHFDDPRDPKLHVIERNYAGDPTNWWAPDRAGTEAMLRASGFRIEAHPEEEVCLCRRAATSVDCRPVCPARPRASSGTRD